MEYEKETTVECQLQFNENITALLVASIFEIFQESLDLFNNTIGLMFAWNWLFQWFGIFRLDLGQTFAYGALGDISMARTNLRCAANTFADLKAIMEPDYAYENEMSYYLNATAAAQQFYLSFNTAHMTIFMVIFW